MKKSALPSEAQAKRIARSWAEGRPINVMKQGREGSDPYNDATTTALVRRAWIEPSGLPHVENGFVWEPHSISAAGLLALECHLQQTRLAKSECGGHH